jgi:hypothetical protein
MLQFVGIALPIGALTPSCSCSNGFTRNSLRPFMYLYCYVEHSLPHSRYVVCHDRFPIAARSIQISYFFIRKPGSNGDLIVHYIYLIGSSVAGCLLLSFANQYACVYAVRNFHSYVFTNQSIRHFYNIFMKECFAKSPGFSMPSLHHYLSWNVLKR